VGRNGITHISYAYGYDFALLFGSCKELPTFAAISVENDLRDAIILILKDDISNYVWLRPCRAADGTGAMWAIVEWCAAFGIVHESASDQGRYF
jgi:hypothetical protein